MGRALYQSVIGKCYDGKKTDANRYLFLDVEAERRGILNGHGIHYATAPERLTRPYFNLKANRNSIYTGWRDSCFASLWWRSLLLCTAQQQVKVKVEGEKT